MLYFSNHCVVNSTHLPRKHNRGQPQHMSDAEIRAPPQTHQMRPPYLKNVKAFLGTERSKSQQKWNRVISISKSQAQKETSDKQQASKPVLIWFCLWSPKTHTLRFCWKAVGRPRSSSQKPVRNNPSVLAGPLGNWYTGWSPAFLRMAKHLPADGKQ